MTARAAFGKLKESVSQTVYLDQKKGISTFCTARINDIGCGRLKNASSYEQRQLYNNGRYYVATKKCPDVIQVNKTNLPINLVSAMNLEGACEIITQPLCNLDNCTKCSGPPVPITLTASGTWFGKPFYQANYLDPIGALFGNTQCGELNWTRYLVYTGSNNM